MPRKKKASAEAEAAATGNETQPAAAPESAPAEPEGDLPKTRRKAPAKKAAKKQSGRAAKGVRAKVTAEKTPGAEPEAAAQAAETFEDAFEANDSGEAATDSDAGIAAADFTLESEREEPKKEAPELPPAKAERLQKILAAAGVASRRHAEQLIVEGRVQVNGRVVTTLGTKADPARDHIRVDGKLIHGAERLRYFVLNKPRGYVTTVSDPEGRPTVMEFFARTGERLYPVGRLDYQSEGLLLMTNDGELANQLTRAASGVEKVYLVKVSGQPDEEKIEALRGGVRIDRGSAGEGRVQTAPARIRQVRQGENPWYEVALIEGRNRELRKMFEEIGHHVEKIRRVGYGPLVLDVEPGKMRELTPEEVQTLRLAAEGKLKPKRIRTSDMLPREAGRTVDLEAGRRRDQRGGKGRDFRREEGGDRPRRPGRGPGSRPERGFEPRRERGFEPRRERESIAREDRGGLRPREERPGRWQERGQDRGQVRGGDRGESRGQERRRTWGQGERQEQGQRPQRGPREERGERESRGRFEGERGGERGGQRRQFGGRGAFPSRPPRFERGGGEGEREPRREFGRGPGRGFGGSQRPQGQRPFRGKPPAEGERPRGPGDRGSRGGFTGGAKDRGPRGGFSGEGPRGSAPRGGGFNRRGPGSGPGQGTGPRSGSRPGGGGYRTGPRPDGGPRSGGGSRPGGPRGRGPGKPGFGKRGPR